MKDDSHVLWFDSVDGVRPPPAPAKKQPSKNTDTDNRQQATLQPKTKSGPKEPAAKTVHVKFSLSLPDFKKFKLPSVSVPSMFRTKRNLYIAAGCFAGALIVGFALVQFIGNDSASPSSANGAGVKSANTPQSVTFQPLLPEGAFQRNIQPRYDAARNTVSFIDNIKGVSLTVSQQQAPKSAELAGIAESAPGIKSTIKTTKGDAIVATDPLAEQQTVVFIDKEVLVFIRTPKLLQDTDWIEYVSKMKTS